MENTYLQDKIQAFLDESTSNQEKLMEEIGELFLEILNLPNIRVPYYCQRCKRVHLRGRIHSDHKAFATPFPILDESKITLNNPNEVYHLQVVGIYYTGNGSYLNSLPSGTRLTLRKEPNNPYDSHAVSVWHNGRKLGYIPRYNNSEIFHALGQTEVTCIFGCYHPSKVIEHVFRERLEKDIGFVGYITETTRDFNPQRADITIEISHPEKIYKHAQYYLHILSYIPNFRIFPIVNLYKKLGYHGFQYLCQQMENDSAPYLTDLYNQILKDYKITIGDVSLLL